MLRALGLAAVLAVPAAAQDLPALHRVTGVAANDVLNVRSQPSAQAPVIGSFDPQAQGIEVTARSPDGRWARVNAGEAAGWSAARFLAPQGEPAWLTGLVPMQCFGTEPFWNLDLFLPGSQAEFTGLDTGGFNLVTDAGALPATRFPPTLAVPFGGAREGMAVIRSATCSDGMSDRLFGLQVQVYWRGQVTGLSGCCSLSPP